MGDSITIIANDLSGEDRDTEQVLRESLKVNGIKAEIAVAKSGEEILKLARRALENGARMIVAAGGDGTVSAVASVVAGTDVALGVLPLGTLNHFAKDLEIPLDVEDAVATLLTGHVTRLDVGEVNGRIFINNSSLGLYPHMVGHRREQQRLGRNKWVALVWSAMTMLGRYPRLRVSVKVDGREKITTTPLLFIGNNEYALHGFEIGTRPRLDAGTLSLYLPHHVGRLGFVWLAVRALAGHLRDAESFDATSASEILIETRGKRLRVAVDGEVTTMETPLRYRIRPGVLHVMVPEKKEEGKKDENEESGKDEKKEKVMMKEKVDE